MSDMPRKPIDFSKTLIYKIVCKNTELCDKLYIGRTTNFVLRKSQHKVFSNQNKSNVYLYKVINEFGGWDNWEMQLLENYPCTNTNDANERERYYIITLKAELNSVVAINSNTDNELRQSIYKQEWYIKNRQRLADNYKKNTQRLCLQKR